MDYQKLKNISTALYSYSAVDFNDAFLQQISIQDLLDIITLNEDERAIFRAAWALEHLLLKNSKYLLQYQLECVLIYLDATNWSLLRSISKIIMTLLKKPMYSATLHEDHTIGHILDKSFKLIENKDCPIALRCNVYDIIFLAGQNEKWVLSELKTQLYFDLEKSPTPALKSRARRLLNKLERIT